MSMIVLAPDEVQVQTVSAEVQERLKGWSQESQKDSPKNIEQNERLRRATKQQWEWQAI